MINLITIALAVVTSQARADIFPLKVPKGFVVEEIASGVGNARGMNFSPEGDLYVNDMEGGNLIALSRSANGTWSRRTIVTGLETAHSLAFHNGDLWVAEMGRVRRFKGDAGPFKAEDGVVVVPDLPDGGHVTRTILFEPDGHFLVSVGSSCNVCREDDRRRAAITRYNEDGSGGTIFAEGMRNAVGIAWRPGTAELWATCNGRDRLGDDLPPECVFRVERGKHYGWPFTYGFGTRDPDFGRDDFTQTGFPAFTMPAHCAPLGLTFYDAEQFPNDCRGDLFVCLHGSWNRSKNFPPQVIRVSMKRWLDRKAAEFKHEQFTGPFVTGFLTGFQDDKGNRWGRPVCPVVGPDGALYVSDDQRGAIYRIFAAPTKSGRK